MATFGHYTKVNYLNSSKEEKRVIIAIIRRYYPSCTIRDIASGLHSLARTADSKESCVITDMKKVAEYSQNKNKS